MTVGGVRVLKVALVLVPLLLGVIALARAVTAT